MLPLRGSLFAASRSKSSSRLPSSTTTRVSSAWEASISMRFVIERWAPRRSGRKSCGGGGSGWGGPDDGGRTARTLHMRRPPPRSGGAHAHGAAGAPTAVFAAAQGHPGPRPRVGALVPRLARATRTVRRIGASPAEAGTTELAGRVSVAGGRLDPPSASAAWRDLSRGDGRGRPGLLTLGESPAKRGNRGRPRGRVGSMPGSPGCGGRPPSSLAVAALP